ncbi:hypothetical protein ABD76_00195 [Paenibacillus dendritiformis]|nr:PH domain-containing protein [Paenibacillus dendritiformis]MBG9791042.1 hypothetical protein [Paenibacillus dendritiformis]
MRTIVVIVVIIGIAAPFFTYWQSRTARVEFNEQVLLVGGGWYRVEVPYEAITAEGIVVGPAPQTSLSIRTNGIGWPGFGLGWFRNAAGQRVFALMRSGESVYVPTRLDFDIVVADGDAEAFVREVRVRSQR